MSTYSLIKTVYVRVFLSLLYEFSFIDARNLTCEIVLYKIVACRPVVRQRPWNKQLYDSRLRVTAPPTDTNATIPQQQLHCNRRALFSTQSVPRCYKQDKLVERVSRETAGSGELVS
jgi:hypothetical protein